MCQLGKQVEYKWKPFNGESLGPLGDIEGGCEKSYVSIGVGGAPQPGPIVIFLW